MDKASALEAARPLAGTRPADQVAVAGRGWHRRRRALLYLLVILIAVWSLFPFLFGLQLSLMDTIDVVAKPPSAIPDPVTLRAWQLLLFPNAGIFREYGGFEVGKTVSQVPQTMLNSVIIASGTMLLNLVLGSLAGYAYARSGHFRFMQGTLLLLMVTRMLPSLALAIPFFIFFRTWGLLDTRHGLIIAYTSLILPLTIWIMTNYFKTIPRSLEWAARVDGASWFQAFWRVFLPVATPGLIAAGIFTFIVAWNEFLLGLLLTSTPNSRPVSVAVASIYYGFRRLDDYTTLFASAVLATLPPVLIAFVLQRYLIQGMLSGSSKG